MKKSINGAFLLNMIVIFLLLVFALLAATFSYAKAYRLNSKIVNAIERFEGYNSLSKTEIDYYLGNLGYTVGNSNNCQTSKTVHSKTGYLIKLSENFDYCIYKVDNDTVDSIEEETQYYSYIIVTYIIIDFPVIGSAHIPVTAKTNRIYRFGN